MKSNLQRSVSLLFSLALAATPLAAAASPRPWQAAGLDDREAAAHLLDRFAFGARPGEIDRVVAMGIDAWIEAQLGGEIDDSAFVGRIRGLDAWSMSADEIARTFPPFPLLRREAIEAGVLDESSPLPGSDADREELAQMRRALVEFSRERGYRPQRELLGQLLTHKVLQAVYSERQLEAVLVDFWFNHFNVSLTDFQTRTFLLPYERDAIAPGVLGRFEDMLVETAAHPAMLVYLDNFQSTAKPGVRTTLEARTAAFGGDRSARRMQRRRPPNANGLNENYARELLELHTLGVDAGYTQDDVIEVARAFTGWSIVPYGPRAAAARSRLDRVRDSGLDLGFVVREPFLFRADAHDADPKVVLGEKLAAGRGLQDGLDVLHLLATHPATAHHLAAKLAVRFVGDDPPPALVERLAARFSATDGDLAAVMRELAYSPEFWQSRGEKIKSPFELAISAVRALGAEVRDPADLVDWISHMGEPLYAYQAPTGYPDRAEAWVNTGALLTRMNFGLSLAAGRVIGTGVDLAGLTGGREPESLDQALSVYAGLLLPARPLEETLARLEPIVKDPRLGERLAEITPEEGSGPPAAPRRYGTLRAGRPDDAGMDVGPDVFRPGPDGMAPGPGALRRELERRRAAATPPEPVANVVGVILGSPEFQRR